jgi:hypothetical protein
VPVVWLDRATMTLVRYAGEKPAAPPADWLSDDAGEPRAEESGDQRLGTGRSRPKLVVTVQRADRHYQNAFEARSEPLLRLMRDIADDRVSDERARQASEERAIFGDY